MAYDEDVANRVRELVSVHDGIISERRMFGGLAFLVNGNLAVAASSAGGLMLRVDPVRSEDLVAEPGASRMVMQGREMGGWLRIATSQLGSDDEFARWVGLGIDYATTLPPK